MKIFIFNSDNITTSGFDSISCLKKIIPSHTFYNAKDHIPIGMPIQMTENWRKMYTRIAMSLYSKLKAPVIVYGCSIECLNKNGFPGAMYPYVSQYISPVDLTFIANYKPVNYRYSMLLFDGIGFTTETKKITGIIKAPYGDTNKSIEKYFYPIIENKISNKSIHNTNLIQDLIVDVMDNIIIQLDKLKSREIKINMSKVRSYPKKDNKSEKQISNKMTQLDSKPIVPKIVAPTRHKRSHVHIKLTNKHKIN